jgi:hypothetical protein
MIPSCHATNGSMWPHLNQYVQQLPAVKPAAMT